MDFERDSSEKPVTEREGVMFAAQPIWEQRGRKRRGFGRKAAAPAAAPTPTVSPEPRTFAAERDYEEPMALDTPVAGPLDRPMADRAMGHDYVRAEYAPAAAPVLTEEADSGMVAPIGRATTRADRGPKSRGIGPAAIAASIVTLGAIGAVGWYASRDNDGIPEIAPGSPTTSEVATAPLPPVDMPPAPQVADTAVNPTTTAATSAPPRQTVRAAPVRTAQAATRTRPAAAPSATDTAVNTSATLPAGPQPYSTLNSGATPPAPVNPTVTPTPPSQAAPAPTEAPAAVPEPTPTLPSQTTPPEPETTVTPPTS